MSHKNRVTALGEWEVKERRANYVYVLCVIKIKIKDLKKKGLWLTHSPSLHPQGVRSDENF